MPAMPAHPDALAVFPPGDAAAARIDPPRDFMARHTRILKPGPQALFNEHIAVANAARLHLHAHLSSAGLTDVAFYQFPVSAWFADLRRLHFVHNWLDLISNLYQDLMNSSRSLLSWFLLVSPRLCAPPGYIFKMEFLTSFDESIAEAPMGTI